MENWKSKLLDKKVRLRRRDVGCYTWSCKYWVWLYMLHDSATPTFFTWYTELWSSSSSIYSTCPDSLMPLIYSISHLRYIDTLSPLNSSRQDLNFFPVIKGNHIESSWLSTDQRAAAVVRYFIVKTSYKSSCIALWHGQRDGRKLSTDVRII